MKIILSAFACQPNCGTEPGNGWGYAKALAAKDISVHVLTTKESQYEIEKELRKCPMPGLTFHFPNEWPLGLFRGSKLRYLAWQWFAFLTARRIHRLESFDIAHHITYGSIHVPTLLWMLQIPTIFGPVGGGQTAPKKMLKYFQGARHSERLRSLLTACLRYSPIHRYCLQKMAAVLVSNRDTEELCEWMGCKRIEFVSDTAIPKAFLAPTPKAYEENTQHLKLLWVGRLLPRKAIELTLDMVAKAKCKLELTIVGTGMEEDKLRTMISERGLNKVVTWDNRRLPWIEVRETYSKHDAMIFTSLRDSCGAQLLESMASGLPVICLDLHGAADLVPSGAGIKIRVDHPAQVISDGATAIEDYSELKPKERGEMSRIGWEYADALTFECRAEYIDGLYKRLLG